MVLKVEPANKISNKYKETITTTGNKFLCREVGTKLNQELQERRLEKGFQSPSYTCLRQVRGRNHSSLCFAGQRLRAIIGRGILVFNSQQIRERLIRYPRAALVISASESYLVH